MTIILQCPVCRSPLLNAAGGYQCSHHHTFDSSREGYVNLLLVQKKHSKEPGDSKDMLQSRRRFLELGQYNRIADAVNEAVAAHLAASGRIHACNILDAGCGEGYYLASLRKFLEQGPNPLPIEYYGVDISKSGVRLATQRDRTMNWFVASILDLPFAAASFGMVLNVFSPANFPEFARVLEDNGGLVLVTPGPKHLNGLREIIYPEAREHAAPPISEEAATLFTMSSETRINYRMELAGSEAIMDLLAMTPYYWNIDLKTKAAVQALDRLATDVDVVVRVLTKKAANLNGERNGS